MPEFTFIGPNGEEKTLVGPEGATREDAARIFSQSMGAKPSAPAPTQPNPIMQGINTVGDFVSGAGEAIGNVAGQLKEAYQGKQDPRYAETPAFDESMAYGAPGKPGLLDFPQLVPDQVRAKMFAGLDDEAYGNMLAEQLGPNLLGREKDANGYEILTFRGQDGKPQKAYVNKPGADFQDVDRFVAAASPYVAGGGVVGAGAKAVGGSLATRMGAQAVGQGLTDIGVQSAAQRGGSGQDISLGRTALASGLGGAAEFIPPAVLGPLVGTTIGAASTEGDTKEKIVGGILGGVTGFGTGKVMSAQRAVGSKYLNKGQLTDEAKEAAKVLGFDPGQMTKYQQQKFAEGMATLQSPQELASQMRTTAFKIPTTRATRTKDPMESAIEKDLRAGTGGERAKQVFKNFDSEQRTAIREAALQREGLPVDLKGNPYNEGIGAMIAPNRRVTTPDEIGLGELGSSISGGLRAGKQAADKAVKEAWKGLEDVAPRAEAMQALSKKVGDTVRAEIDTELTPAAARMIKEIDDFRAGKVLEPTSEMLGQRSSLRGIDRQRQRLLAAKDTASTDTDKRAAGQVYDAYNKWVDDIIDQGVVAGKPETVSGLRTARNITREMKSIFRPDRAGKSPESKILKKIIENADTPERVISDLFGESVIRTAKEGTNKALAAIKRAVLRGDVIGKKAGQTLWNDIRLAYWSKIVFNKKGQMESPQLIINNIEQAFAKQSSTMRQLFDAKELSVFRRFAEALKETTFKDPNPAGTATVIRLLAKKDFMGSMRLMAQTQQKRELFSKGRVLMARMWQLIARKIPVDPLNVAERTSAAIARRSTGQTPQKRRPPGRRGFITGAGVEAYDRNDAASNAMYEALEP